MKKLDNIIVIDVESTCWDGPPPFMEESEIIEVGICFVDVQTRVGGYSNSFFVHPIMSTVSDFCTTLTGITSQKLTQEGIDFGDLCDIIRLEYLGERCTWASYGDYDRKMFMMQCSKRGVSYPFSDTHLNIKNLFAIKYKLRHEVGMARALKMLNIPLEGRHHSGKDDAKNTAKILSDVLS